MKTTLFLVTSIPEATAFFMHSLYVTATPKRMKKLLSLLAPAYSFSQVGINTTTPELCTAIHIAGGTVKAKSIPTVTSADFNGY